MEYADPDGPPVDAFLRRGKRSHCHVTFDPPHCCSIDRSSSHLKQSRRVVISAFQTHLFIFFVACTLYLRTTVSVFFVSSLFLILI